MRNLENLIRNYKKSGEGAHKQKILFSFVTVASKFCNNFCQVYLKQTSIKKTHLFHQFRSKIHAHRRTATNTCHKII